MMNEKKITKREHFNNLLGIEAVASNEDLVAFIKHEIELLDNKKSENRKPTATQLANADLKANILAEMEDGKAYTITDMIKELPSCTGLSTSKVSSMVNQMIKESGAIQKTEEKRRSYFSKVVG